MWQIAVLTLICLLGAVVGTIFIEGSALKILLYLLGCVLWLNLTFYWWMWPLLEKLIRK